jgi:KUP system potassium uptake protein
MVTFITTCMISLVALIIWRLHIAFVLAFFIVFGTLDGLYLSAVLTKVPQGAWFTLLLAAILSSIFILWRFGKEQQWKAERSDRFQPGQLMKKNENGEIRLTDAFGGASITSISGERPRSETPQLHNQTTNLSTFIGIGIFFDKSGDLVPLVYANFVRKFEASPAVSIFLHMRHLPTPSIPEAQRYIIGRTSIPSCYRVIVRSGYMDDIITSNLAQLLVDQITLFITSDQAKANFANPVDKTNISNEDAAIRSELEALRNAQSQQTVYIVGKEQMRIAQGTNIVRKALLAVFLWIRENARSKIVGLNIPMEQLVEVGFVKEI